MALHKAGRIQRPWWMLRVPRWLDAPPSVRAALEAEAEPHEYHGPLVLGHSRLDHAVLGSDLESRFLDEVVSVLFPGSWRDRISSRDPRDAMHIAWAKRYGFDFITSE